MLLIKTFFFKCLNCKPYKNCSKKWKNKKVCPESVNRFVFPLQSVNEIVESYPSLASLRRQQSRQTADG